MIYGNIALREIADIDTIIHPKDLSRAKAALLANGYFTDPNHANPDDQAAVSNRNKYDITLWREDRQVCLELHWKVSADHSWHAYKEADFWNLTRPQAIGNRRIIGLEREFIFILLCIHNEKHNWHGLRYLADVATMLQAHADMDWERVVRQAKDFDKFNSLLVTCNLCAKLLGVEIPPLIRQHIRNNGLMRAKCAMIRARMFCDNDGFRFPSYREWRLHCRLFTDGPQSATGWLDPVFYLIIILWPEYLDKTPFVRRFFVLHPKLTILYVFTRLTRYIKWNWLSRKCSMSAQKKGLPSAASVEQARPAPSRPPD
jgi:hypothetical protein